MPNTLGAFSNGVYEDTRSLPLLSLDNGRGNSIMSSIIFPCHFLSSCEDPPLPNESPNFVARTLEAYSSFEVPESHRFTEISRVPVVGTVATTYVAYPLLTILIVQEVSTRCAFTLTPLSRHCRPLSSSLGSVSSYYRRCRSTDVLI